MTKKDNIDMKEEVRSQYSEIAKKKKPCCCSKKSEEKNKFSFFSEDYQKVEGHIEEADLQLGCGIPTQIAKIKKGDTVVDLGSGAGNDAFIVRHLVGEEGKVIGIDFTEEMVKRAKENCEKLHFKNIEFILGEIEDLPLEENLADVVVSNCVLNLVPSKEKAFQEIKRILKDGGHFTVSDMVLKGDIPDKLRVAATAYAGCISGALQYDEYVEVIKKVHFRNISIPKEREIDIPEEILRESLTEEEFQEFKTKGVKLLSITVYGEK